MSLPIRVLTISDCHSDGDSSKWPAPEKGLTRNDGHFLEKIANEKWAKDISHATLGGPPSIAAWRLNRLPDGYAGFEKARPDSKHIDRYIYGHPQGVFRSINEFYPHFKHLMDNGGADGCQCKLCSGNRKRASYGGATSSSNGTKSVSPARRSHYFSSSQTAPSAKAQQTAPPLFNQRGRPNGFALLPQGRLESPPAPRPPRKQIDEDGTPDVIREMLNELKSAEEGTVIDRKIEERLSPDWRMGHELLEDLIDNWKKSPGFVPRSGELVLFARDMKLHEGLAWEKSINSWRKVDQNTGELLARPQWEAGVITQMPEQQVEGIDLSYLPESKSNVTISGFRIEPLSKLGSKSKPHSKQYRYLPLHGIRPLSLWQYCLRDLPEPEWHETVQHSLAALNALCVVGRKRFKGIRDGFAGPEATIFCQGAYIGSELILTGDTIRLLPNPDEQQPGETTDILIVTAIKLRLVNINEAGSDDWDEGRPYTTCLHLSGRAFTLDPRRCFDGIGKTLVPSDSSILPSGLREYGQWYYMTDPTDSKARLEVPFTRFFSRAAESVALNTWFKSDKPVATFSAVNIAKSNNEVTRPVDVKHGLSGLVQARAYAAQEDPRIDRAAGKSWFWADTRTEALDLHEVNNRFVGPKDDTRTRKQMDDWRKALKALDGSKSGLADYHAAMQKREEEARKEREVLAAGSYGMVGAVVTVPSVDTSGSGTEGEAQAVQQKEDVDMVDPDEDDEDDGEGMEDLAEKFKMKHQNTVIQFSDEDDDDDDDVDDDDDDA